MGKWASFQAPTEPWHKGLSQALTSVKHMQPFWATFSSIEPTRSREMVTVGHPAYQENGERPVIRPTQPGGSRLSIGQPMGAVHRQLTGICPPGSNPGLCRRSAESVPDRVCVLQLRRLAALRRRACTRNPRAHRKYEAAACRAERQNRETSPTRPR